MNNTITVLQFSNLISECNANNVDEAIVNSVLDMYSEEINNRDFQEVANVLSVMFLQRRFNVEPTTCDRYEVIVNGHPFRVDADEISAMCRDLYEEGASFQVLSNGVDVTEAIEW